ncbi:putative membrane protein [Paenibacillus shirakamiensis]|uniref:Membrane protein n=1 Tax=Paenibacillus shirakamiensis TaxID=1265935 RepID=A0ABS4JM13_9BACL|nr:hypothetical protein [Paenibacillus shirakamiensis]MBP2002016.1 putative membrane protein [Paenibacillus shirakamiensis]
MKTNRPSGFAVVLIALGVLILIGKLTPLLGSLFGILISLVVIGLGYYGIRKGNAFFGWIILFFGVVSLLSKLAWIIVPLLGIGLIVYGFSALKKRRTY